MKVTFKDVGQGDSILLEWTIGQEKKVGIIDCNNHQGENPVLEYIDSQNYGEIEFIFLSHPHFDHFSGLRELLEFCESEGIKINKFLHTSFQSPTYLKSAVKSTIANFELAKLFKKIQKLRYSKDIIRYQTYVSNDIRPIKLTDDIFVEVLAPSTKEFDNFISKSFTNAEENTHSCPHGNWLSTVLKVNTKDGYILLTSDVELSVLKDLGYNQKEKFKSNLILGQSPHHGSRKNHSNAFWRNRKRKEAKIVFSVGNNSYQHPSAHVVKKFKNYNYEIYSTNLVGGLVPDESQDESQISEKDLLLANLDINDPEKNPQNTRYQGDKKFKVKNGRAILTD